MGLLTEKFFKTAEKYKGYISKAGEKITEAFKSEVSDDQIRFPKDLGVEHPFSFEDLEKVYCSVGYVSGIVNKYTNSIVGEFSYKLKNDNPNIRKIIDTFIKESNFSSKVREWVREGILKGNGFMEIDLENNKLKVINANTMFIKRDIHGEVIAYNQYIGSRKSFEKSQVVPFGVNQIAHIKIDPIAGQAYGRGKIINSERAIENKVLNEQEIRKILQRIPQ